MIGVEILEFPKDANAELRLDLPITSTSQDTLNRSEAAHDFAKFLGELDASQGIVIGICGPWGSGKSSFVNLMREPLNEESELTVIDFNPWMFSGTNQLVSFFFNEIAAQLKMRDYKSFKKVARLLGNFADMLKPMAGFLGIPGVTRAGEGVGAFLKGLSISSQSEKSAQDLRVKISQQLEKLTRPVLVVIDDLDRLTTGEIREIFKLVRLTASFPNVIYLLSFDRKRVEQALSDAGISGRDYLEKIIQVSYDLPRISSELLENELILEIERIISPLPILGFNEARWVEVLFDVILPLFSNLRDVKRYSVSAQSNVRALADNINVIDLLALEAIRVFCPDLMLALGENAESLTNRGLSIRISNPSAQKAIVELISNSTEASDYIQASLRHLFPASLQHTENHLIDDIEFDGWRADRRVANGDFFNLYLERVMPRRLMSFKKAEDALMLMDDEEILIGFFEQLAPEDILPVLKDIGKLSQKFKLEMAVPSSVVLLNLIDSIPDNDSGGMFVVHPKYAVSRIFTRLFEGIENQSERESYANKVIERVDTYSSRLFFIDVLGYGENIGRELVSEKFFDSAKAQLVRDVQKSLPDFPAREWDAGRVYYTTMTETGSVNLTADSDPYLLLAVVRSLMGSTRSQTSDSREVHVEYKLAWEPLVDLFGSEENLKLVFAEIRKALGDSEELHLGEKYLSGWRP